MTGVEAERGQRFSVSKIRIRRMSMVETQVFEVVGVGIGKERLRVGLSCRSEPCPSRSAYYSASPSESPRFDPGIFC